MKRMQEIESNQNLIDCNNTTKSMDTVGAIVLDLNGNFASGVSSGGILLKHPGRIGHASIYGCGCWVSENENESVNKKQQIAICTTGCGEHIMKTLFAKECADFMFNGDSDANLLKEFMDQRFFSNYYFAIETYAVRIKFLFFSFRLLKA